MIQFLGIILLCSNFCSILAMDNSENQPAENPPLISILFLSTSVAVKAGWGAS